jgi:cell division protein FtsB
VKRLTLIAAAVLVVVALGVFAGIVSQGFEELARAEAERDRLEQERLRLSQRIRELQSTLDGVRSNPEAVESLARHDLGWVRPGETVVIIATPGPRPAPPSLTEPAPTPILTLPD